MAQAGNKQTRPTKLPMMRKRAEFLGARNGVRANGVALRIEVVAVSGDRPHPRTGITVTKKNGNAVMRNRIKRRMRAAIISAATDDMRHGHDYVFISKPNALTAPFDTLRTDIAGLIERSHKRLDSAG